MSFRTKGRTRQRLLAFLTAAVMVMGCLMTPQKTLTPKAAEVGEEPYTSNKRYVFDHGKGRLFVEDASDNYVYEYGSTSLILWPGDTLTSCDRIGEDTPINHMKNCYCSYAQPGYNERRFHTAAGIKFVNMDGTAVSDESFVIEKKTYDWSEQVQTTLKTTSGVTFAENLTLVDEDGTEIPVGKRNFAADYSGTLKTTGTPIYIVLGDDTIPTKKYVQKCPDGKPICTYSVWGGRELKMDSLSSNGFHVTYDLDGGYISEENQYKTYFYFAPSSYSYTYVKPVKLGYRFVSWDIPKSTLLSETKTMSYVETANLNISGLGSGNWSAAKNMAGSTTKLTAKWEDATVWLYFDPNDGEIDEKSSTYTKSVTYSDATAGDTSVFTDVVPTRAGYDFNGWYLNGQRITCLNDIPKSAWNNNQRYSLTALWTPNGSTPVVKHTVYFNTNGGSAVAKQNVTSGAKAVKPADPTKTDYTFKGWYTDSSLTKAYDFNTAVTKDITLHAKWEKKQTQEPPKEDPPKEDPPKEEPKVTPAVDVTYHTHIQTYGDSKGDSKNGEMSGTSGESKRLENVQIKVSGNDNLGIQYTTHCQSYGWMPWSTNWEKNGTSGESKRMEAIKIQLTGSDADKYDVYYRVHAQTYGWLAWAKNGEPAGTAGYGKRLEGIQIVVLKKDETAPGMNYKGVDASKGKNNEKAYVAKTASEITVPGSVTEPNVTYRTHVQKYGWQSWRTNGAMSGTSGESKRLEGINIKLSNCPYEGGIVYTTHVQKYGWQGKENDPTTWKKNGEMSGTSGEAKRLEAIRIQLTGEMAEHYDVYYRVHAQTYGWLGWAKNGEASGTAGYAKRLEGIQIVLVPKGGAAPANNYGGAVSKDTRAYIKK